MWYIGQMGMIFRWNGITICVDPVLGAMPDDRGVDRRNYPVPFLPEDLQVDYVFCTHGHADHIHGETLRKLAQTNPQMEIYVPKPLTEVVAGYGIRTEQVKGIRQDEPADFREGFSVRVWRRRMRNTSTTKKAQVERWGTFSGWEITGCFMREIRLSHKS